jgi:hypothetical protein
MSLMFLLSPLGMARTHTAEMTRRLKEADPTIVLGPGNRRKKGCMIKTILVMVVDGGEGPTIVRGRIAGGEGGGGMCGSLGVCVCSCFSALRIRVLVCGGSFVVHL